MLLPQKMMKSILKMQNNPLLVSNDRPYTLLFRQITGCIFQYLIIHYDMPDRDNDSTKDIKISKRHKDNNIPQNFQYRFLKFTKT